LLVAASVLLIGFSTGVNNFSTPDDPMRVGMVEVETECLGIDTGVCLGLERQDYTSYNYDDYQQARPGTPDYYRRVESELMAQAYNLCGQDTKNYEWTAEAEYENKTGTEWRLMDEIQLLPCDQTLYRSLDASK